MEIQAAGVCWSCGSPLTRLDYGRADRCSRCGRDTKVCKGCVYYEPGAHNDCRETQAERVVEKERSNFCEYFKPSPLRPGGASGAEDSKEALRKAAEALFKKK
ncbi:MAG: hypothetical protein ACO3A2_02395 [Bdellovibrionia bacterium]